MRSQGRIRNAGGGGGGGGAVRFRPIQKRGGGGGGGGGAVRFRPDTKSGEGGGGVQSASGPIRKVEAGCLPYDDLYHVQQFRTSIHVYALKTHLKYLIVFKH